MHTYYMYIIHIIIYTAYTLFSGACKRLYDDTWVAKFYSARGLRWGANRRCITWDAKVRWCNSAAKNHPSVRSFFYTWQMRVDTLLPSSVLSMQRLQLHSKNHFSRSFLLRLMLPLDHCYNCMPNISITSLFPHSVLT